MNKALKIPAIVLASILALVLLIWGGLWIARAIVYHDYLAEKETVCKIPAIGDGFVPQGLSTAEAGVYLHSGYDGKTHEMRLFVVTEDDTKELIPTDADGKRLEGHGGGIAWAGDFVYVASEGKLTVFRYTDFKNAKEGDRVQCVSTFEVDTEASFCFADGRFIYVGEFYRAEDYETDPSHYFTTPDGTENRALMSAYPLAPDGSLADSYPAYSLSIPHQVQGFAIKGETVVLSRSWGVSSSSLDFYKGMKDSGQTIDVSGKQIPLYYLDSTNYDKTVKLPAFSEGLAVEGDRVLISFESACNKYIVGKLFFANKIVSYPIH